MPRWAIALAALILTGCQTTMSVEEAKKVTAAFVGKPFVPPPKSINDITAILDQQRPADPGAAEEARARADEPAPATDDAHVLRKFYFRRGLAASAIGRTRQEIEDLTRAAGQGPGGSDPYPHEVLAALSFAENRGGNLLRSVEYRRRAIAAVPDNQRGALPGLNSGLAGTLASMGDLKGAEEALAALARVYYESQRWQNQRPEWLAGRRASYLSAQASLAEARGRQAEAEGLYREALAIRLADPVLRRETLIDDLQVFLARTLIRQGRLLEAENGARAALLGALGKRGRYSGHTAFVLSVLAWVIHEQARFREAETLARARVDILERIGSAPEAAQLSNARSQLAGALSAQGRHREALAEYERARAGLSGDPASLKQFFGGHQGYASSLLANGQADRALEIFEVALERTRRLAGDKHRSTAWVRGQIAMARAAKGDRAGALAGFREAIEVLLTRSPDADEEAAAQAAEQRLGNMLVAYIRLLAQIQTTALEGEAGIDAAAEAFRLADVVRGGSVQRALDAGAARAAARTPALADLVRREQDVKKQMTAIHGLLANMLSAPSDQQDVTVVEDLRGQVATLRRARAGLLAQIEKDFPAYAELLNPRPIDLAQTRAALRPGEALISTLVTRDVTFVWAVPREGPAAFAAVPVSRQGLVDAVQAVRKALEPDASTVGDVPPFDVGRAHEVYRHVLEPVRAGWERAASLLVVAHGPLGQLPFSLLVTRPVRLGPEAGPLFANYRAVPWLVRTHAVTVLPSVTALRTLRTLPPGDPGRRAFVGFGDPYFNEEQAQRAAARARVGAAEPPAGALTTRGLPLALRSSPRTGGVDSAQLAMLPRLPETADEIRSVALAMHADLTRDVFTGARASERAVKTARLAEYRVIVFATHGLVPGELDGLTQPALALSAPTAADQDDDGLLTMEEILALRLDADWVVLSACNTASGQGAGSEAISGLGRAFFYAGARALLVSNWPVETTSAKLLTTDLFRRQTADARLSRARALQQTMATLIDEAVYRQPRTGEVAFSYAHPIFWAPFTLIGDGGGGR